MKDYSETRPLNKKRIVRSESPPPLRIRYNRPYKTIVLSFFLLSAGILFTEQGIIQYQEKGLGETYPIFILAIMLLIPGVFYSGMFILIVLGIGGFTYEMLPSVNN
ncbi:unnamed protein product [Paramecium primaurelia]|uniref:Transmembrane protein 230 n=1 Tax=Paramecium primaurelia TaxID=5886 RepID=A0A8S1K796_PARPR|nr:unnamed protein product [Paramecium primaurelia]